VTSVEGEHNYNKVTRRTRSSRRRCLENRKATGYLGATKRISIPMDWHIYSLRKALSPNQFDFFPVSQGYGIAWIRPQADGTPFKEV
jgi:hypothetical protein